jgi:hypothetical protein
MTGLQQIKGDPLGDEAGDAGQKDGFGHRAILSLHCQHAPIWGAVNARQVPF